MAIVTMQDVLQTVLSQGNKEQNMAYPPGVFSDHFNLVTSFLVTQIAKLFPTSQPMVDIIRPFLMKTIIPVKTGRVTFPKNYRHLLGAGIFVTSDFKSQCDPAAEEDCDDCRFDNDPLGETEKQHDELLIKRQCISQSVRIVDIAEWDNLTRHSYKKPTLEKPIACIFEGDGLKVCPFEVPQVELRYIMQPKTYKYGYKMNPDDTYSFSPIGTVESEWTDNAKEFLVTGITKLYSIYTRDGVLMDGLQVLSQAGIF